MTVITRFAPSPTGFLHIGGARTALFNWLFARHHGGEFILRVEDTDRKRSTDEAIEAILDGLSWLGLEWDGDTAYQFKRSDWHAQMAQVLLDNGNAYKCYTPAEEITAARAAAQEKGEVFRFKSPWRDKAASDAPANTDFVVRLRAPLEGETVIDDAVQGSVTFPNSEMDDMVLLRSDGTPTYMMAVVIDDHDMGVTHVIRGDDHLTNAGRQAVLYKAFGWDLPTFAHIPLIHGADGAKLSKRHGALGVDAYRDMGYLPEALRNYLLRLGWSHGDDEIISTEQAIEWFDLGHIGKSPSRMDMAKLDSINAQYLRELAPDDLLQRTLPFITERLDAPLEDEARARLLQGLPSLCQRAKTLIELADAALFYAQPRPVTCDDKATKVLVEAGVGARLQALSDHLSAITDWQQEPLDAALAQFVETTGLKFKEIGMPLRAALAGTLTTPGVGEVLSVFGKTEALARLRDAASNAQELKRA